MTEYGEDQGVHFEKIEPQNLDEVAVVAQCLDNQWVPRELLKDMTGKGSSLEDVAAERSELVRAEYLRALLTAKQVVVNRAFLYNNHAIIQDFAQDGPARKAFVKLLHNRAIIPYFYKEESPVQRTREVQTVRGGFEAWTSACLEAEEISCLRLSWFENRNADLTEKLGLSFHHFALTVPGRAMRGGGAEFSRHLGFPEADIPEFRAVLRKVQEFAIKIETEKERGVTRQELYVKFITPEGDDPTLGRCDNTKPFAAELKQLFDLQYNTGLPEFLDRLPLRPADTLHRSALRESVPERRSSNVVDPGDLERTLKTRIAFDTLSEKLNPLQTASLLDLGIQEIARVRLSTEWEEYIRQLNRLVVMRDPAQFGLYAQNIIESYGAVLRRLGERSSRHAWLTQRRAILEISGVKLRVCYGRRPTMQQMGEITGEQMNTMATVKTVIVNKLSAVRRPAEPELAVDTLRSYIGDPRHFLEQLKSALSADGFDELPRLPNLGRSPAGVEQDVEQQQAS
ncbi:hypothetical protein [Pseudonocardia humida]|uniref:Uncharacterized protein n=1 Tax=Pseudonocardia humida TaxID=2800819 RepID=A0ABT1A526_9PSEU|nr:hypothetical protein [Pseudonocardia humida]MCO1658107.1 hypothetical protein [Pseudonocardia humida]